VVGEETPDSMIENFELATTRFDWILRRVKSHTAAEFLV
jgi:hypothetical protein